MVAAGIIRNKKDHPPLWEQPPDSSLLWESSPVENGLAQGHASRGGPVQNT